MEQFFFFLFAAGAVISALLVISRRNVMHCALFLVLTFFFVAAIFVLLKAEFLAAVQVLVYAGAIMVLFTFVIFLVHIPRTEKIRQTFRQKNLALALGLLLGLEVAYILYGTMAAPASLPAAAPVGAVGNTESFGVALFTRFLFPFEVVSVLLLAAMIGAIVLAKKEIDR
ncbi:MAG: NADH-quinone oxidoreductase subunit J [Candidatus Tectomicrobia bacterium]|uniref:NADH-quinone oxidoreductase subunit J n=1 Tax=Tectimicrobiota bacterium TaxID=2528274 RepID=A0A932GNC0_UNCTE|nr:NADH-quinone oxidoreductase subunit J [Candidatus Tectomicrobia bacterium]